MFRILIAEDEEPIANLIRMNLTKAGYLCTWAPDGKSAADLMEREKYDLALLDIMLPGIDGFEVCRRIRATNTKIGIIMLTARSQEMDKVTGLMTGADDYVTKPFSPAELTARVDALFRRAGGEEVVQSGEISQPPFLLNTRNRTLEKNGQRVKLTQVEYAIMRVFMENPGKALSREEILDRVWGRDYFGELKIVVNTPYYMTENNQGSFSKTEKGYELTLPGLPEGELTFTLSEAERPQPPKRSILHLMPTELIIVPAAVLAAGAAVFLPARRKRRTKR